MAKLYFHYSTMNAGKSTLLLQASHNYRERGMVTYLLTARLDDRSGSGRIASRIGIGEEADIYDAGTDLLTKLTARLDAGPVDCVFLDEAQFLTKEQVWQLARAVDDLGMPVMCYGLRADFRGELFPGSAALLALADEMREVRTICHCGKKATMVVRRGADGKALRDGAQIQIGGNETYVSLCRRHWREEIGDLSVADASKP
jgi:thymidine kinase